MVWLEGTKTWRKPLRSEPWVSWMQMMWKTSRLGGGLGLVNAILGGEPIRFSQKRLEKKMVKLFDYLWE